MPTLRVAIAVAIGICLTACANVNTLHRWTWLPGGGQALHLDAPQRVVLTDERGFSCAEPSPDALQAYASALGASVASPESKAISISGAMNAGSGSIGLRTQSITLMRETLYRLCEAARNKSLTSVDLTLLLQRSQDMTLAVLAIEQLTGAVAARQVLLSGSSNASSAANVANTQAALDSAKKNEQIAKDAVAAAQEEEKRQTAALQTIDQAITAEKQKTPPVQAELDKLAKQRDAQDAVVTRAKDASKVANDNYLAAQRGTQAIASNFNAAIATAQASASGSGAFSDVSERNYISKDTVQQIAEATKQIVANVVNKGHLTDTCITLMTQYAQTRDDGKPSPLDYLMRRCEQVLDSYLKVWEAGVSKTASGGSAPTPASPSDKSPANPSEPAPMSGTGAQLETLPIPPAKGASPIIAPPPPPPRP